MKSTGKTIKMKTATMPSLFSNRRFNKEVTAVAISIKNTFFDLNNSSQMIDEHYIIIYVAGHTIYLSCAFYVKTTLENDRESP